MSLILAYQGRGITKDITIKDGAGNPITPGDNDKIRVVIGRDGRVGTDLSGAELIVSSDEETDNGSSFTKGGGDAAYINRLRLDASDLLFKPGIYTAAFEYFDNADAQEWKEVDRQILTLIRTD